MQILHSAQKQLLSLPMAEAESLLEALLFYQTNQRGYIKWLEKRPGYRIKIGNYRVLFEFEDTNNELIILNFAPSKTKQER